jgi:Tol biopolymer transport system component
MNAGFRLGHFEITERIGAGGMGEVYKARDTRLDRTVAVKVLPPHVAADRQSRERFEREARAVAALNHPHICTLHDIGSQDGIDFLVMEYVEGETLAVRLEKGPLPLDVALQYAIEIASGLDRAHRAGIVHRDIKPGNIMLTKAGTKLLDFGLAKASAPAVAGVLTTQQRVPDLTEMGLILGTVQYMAPEQIEGGTVDARSDIFAFGAVLYEMVTGRRAFAGTSQPSVMAAIVGRDPPRVSSIQPLAPASLDRVVSTCLAKEPVDRWQTARDLLRELQWVTEAGGATVGRDPAVARPTRWVVPIVVGALAVAAAAALAMGAVTICRPEMPVPVRDVRFSIYPESGSAFSTPPASVVVAQFALSPDGSALVYVATFNGRAILWVRPLNALAARVLPETEDAMYPFWSADGRSIGFFSQGKLKTVGLDGGALVVRTSASLASRGGAWAPDGTLLISTIGNAGLSRLSADGSVQPALPVLRDAGERSHRWPSLVPDGRHFLFVVRSSDVGKRGIYLAALDSETKTRLVEGDWGARWIDGRLLFIRTRSLMAQTLDLENRRVTGEAVPLVENLGITTTGYAAFDISHAGTLAYSDPWPAQGELLWFGRDGRQLGKPIAPLADYVGFALSPDSGRIVTSRVDPQTSSGDIWLLDVDRAMMPRLTTDPMNDGRPHWSPDGSRVLFASNRTGATAVYTRAADGSRPEEELHVDYPVRSAASIPTHYSRDGSHVLITDIGSSSPFDVWNLFMGPKPRVRGVLETAFNEYHAVLSPDGRWMAYVSDETGAPQVYVMSFPHGEIRRQVSSQGGTEPQWRADGQELYFLGADRTLMAVPVSLRPVFKTGVAVALFQTRVPVIGNPYRQQYAAAADGQRFLVNTAPANAPTPAIHMVLDWRALLDAKRK